VCGWGGGRGRGGKREKEREGGGGSVNKRAVQKFDMERPILKKMSQAKILSMFGNLENLGDNRNISQAWQNIRGNIRNSAKESLGHYE
jgi:hypothetical protein